MVEWSSGGCSAAIWRRSRAERWDTMARADAVAERGAVVGRTEAADAGRALRYAVAAASAAPSSCGVAAAKLRDEGRAGMRLAGSCGVRGWGCGRGLGVEGYGVGYRV